VLVTAPRIVVVGSLNMDLVVRSPRFARPGETIAGTSFLTVPGGKGANQAVAAQRAGGEVAMIGGVGDDAFGVAMRQGLAKEGIDVEHLGVCAGVASGVALITVDDAGENTIIVVAGANGMVSTVDVAHARQTITAAQVVLLQLEVPMPVVEAAARVAHEAGRTVILNAAPAAPLAESLLPLVDYLVVNEIELLAIAGPAAQDEAVAIAMLRERGAGAVVVTLGAAGARLVPVDGPVTLIPAYPVDAVDTTAAGDAFVGAFAVALAEGVPVDDALRRGNAAGALTVTRAGAQPSLPTRAEVDAWLA
jgi:ribokinase